MPERLGGRVYRDGASLAFDVVGEGDPLVLISGFGYPSTMWFRMLPQLSASFRVVTVDNRGVGLSTASGPWTVNDMARDVLAVLDETGCERAHVLGCSMGGVIALELALLAPERVDRLVLACTGLHSADRPRTAELVRMTDEQVRAFQIAGHPRLYGDIAPSAMIDRDLQRLLASPLRGDGLYGQASAMRDHLAVPDEARSVTAPVLVVHGDLDVVTPLAWGEELAGLIPGARLHLVPGAGHALATEAADELVDVTSQFLRERMDEPAREFSLVGRGAK